MGNQPSCLTRDDNTILFPKEFEKVPGHRVLPNPGTIFDLHRKLIDIMPKWVFGVELGCRWRYEPNKYIYGDWLLSHGTPTGFRFGGLYSPNISNNVVTCPHIECDINPSTLATNLVYTYTPDCRFICRFETRNQKDCTDNVIKIDYYGKSSTYSLGLINPSRGVGRVTFGYLTSVTSRLYLGTEVDFEWYQSIMNTQAHVSLAAKYRCDDCTIATTCSINSFDLTYFKRFDEYFQYGTSLVYNKKQKHSVGTLYYQMKTMDGRVRGMINSDLVVGMTYERQLPLICFNFGISILHHMRNNKFSTGLKLGFAPV